MLKRISAIVVVLILILGFASNTLGLKAGFIQKLRKTNHKGRIDTFAERLVKPAA